MLINVDGFNMKGEDECYEKNCGEIPEWFVTIFHLNIKGIFPFQQVMIDKENEYTFPMCKKHKELIEKCNNYVKAEKIKY